MGTGKKNHLKTINAPSHWMLHKTGGIFAPKPRSGPHRSRECLPLALIIRNRLRYANNYREAKSILSQKFVKLDGRVRTDLKFPAGFMDVIQIEKTNDNIRILYDAKGRFILHPISGKEINFKLCKVVQKIRGKHGIFRICTNDGRNIRYADPEIEENDTIKLHIPTGKITKFFKFKVGNICYATSGANRGRIGIITSIEKHPGSFEICQVKDMRGKMFTTRSTNVFVIGNKNYAAITIPKDKGIRLTLIEDRLQKIKKHEGEEQKEKEEPIKEPENMEITDQE